MCEKKLSTEMYNTKTTCSQIQMCLLKHTPMGFTPLRIYLKSDTDVTPEHNVPQVSSLSYVHSHRYPSIFPHHLSS